LDDVSNKGGHSDAAVLDFGMSQPSNGLFFGEAPECGINQTEGIPERNDGVQLGCQGFQIGLGLGELGAGAGRLLTGGGKGGGKGKGKESSGKGGKGKDRYSPY